MSRRLLWRAGLTALAYTLLVVPGYARGQTLSYVGSVQFTTGDYGLPQATTSLALLNGLALRADRLRVWLSIPLILQDAAWVQYGGAGMVPSGGLRKHGVGQMMGQGDGDMTNASNGGGGMSSHVGVGDAFGRAEFDLLNGDVRGRSLRAAAVAKAPLARPRDGLGTGKWDVGGGISWSELLAGNYLFTDATYWVMGRPDSLPVRNTLAYALAIGRPLRTGAYALLASVSGSTPVVEGMKAPVQGGLGVSYRVSEQRFLSGTMSVGLTKTAPTVTLGLGWQAGLWR
ncbi:MAG: hypothetical protein U0163_18950 [Gemmatimonadaceae bacterium]